ncbi:MAG: PIG-L deacetylase family protein [Armatimonadota bacterium]
MEWLAHACAVRETGECVTLPAEPLAGPGRALALSPHPDDPEAIAVTLRMLAEGDWTLHWGIVTGGWSGVQDDFAGPDKQAKAAVREEEQREAARRFGLPEERLTFLRLAESEDGELADTTWNHAQFDAYLSEVSPELVLLPYKEDTNATHRRVYAWFAAWAARQPFPIIALGNEDPKTTAFQPHLRILFDEALATWKADLLECHRSQSTRNQAVRHITFAQRILATNQADRDLPAGMYAERFRVERWSPESILDLGF